MKMYALNVNANSLGGYFSSEQLDMLSIIQCKSYEELVSFIKNCAQLNGEFSKKDFEELEKMDLESLKQNVFKKYQSTFVLHNSDRMTTLKNTLRHMGLDGSDIETITTLFKENGMGAITEIKNYIKEKYPLEYERMIKRSHEFTSLERDQSMDENLYSELSVLNSNLKTFDTMLVGSIKPEVLMSKLSLDEEKKFDFYFTNRDLEFAFKNNKHVRIHSLLTKDANVKLFDGKTKDEVIEIMTKYVKSSIDFINDYNEKHRLQDGSPVINAVDLFNEIVSFDKNPQGEYENIWESKYGLSVQDICSIFKYAKVHKPEGVSYLYNEPFLEDDKRRHKVIETLKEINSISGGLTDTLGTQTHISFRTSDEQIQRCFEDLRKLQEKDGIKIQITEFDLSLSKDETLEVIGSDSEYSFGDVYKAKGDKINRISSIINNSGVKLDGVSYWSLTDGIDCNLERVRTNLLNSGVIKDISGLPTVCGGLIPTSKEYVKSLEDNYVR